GQRHPALRGRIAIHGAHPCGSRLLHPAQRAQARQRGLAMANVSTTADLGTAGRAIRTGSISRSRKNALYWSYFFLVVFVIFFLTPPLYMLITSLKSSAEIGTATNPRWVFNPTLENFWALISSEQFQVFFRNSVIVSVCVVSITMVIAVMAAF